MKDNEAPQSTFTGGGLGAENQRAVLAEELQKWVILSPHAPCIEEYAGNWCLTLKEAGIKVLLLHPLNASTRFYPPTLPKSIQLPKPFPELAICFKTNVSFHAKVCLSGFYSLLSAIEASRAACKEILKIILSRHFDTSLLLTAVISDFFFCCLLSSVGRGLPFNRLVFVEHLPADLPGGAEFWNHRPPRSFQSCDHSGLGEQRQLPTSSVWKPTV